MKKNYFVYAAAFALTGLSLFTSCSDDKTDETVVPTTPTATNEVVISSDITGARSLVKDSVYILQGQINVFGTINIAAGTVIKGDKISKGTLVIVPGGRINAMGTASMPIVFTSRQAAGLRAAGDWGGLVICGKATCNQTTAKVEGLSREVIYSGGTNDADNSGTLQYVRIEFAGIALQPDKEINGLTLCAVGSATTIDHIQVSFSGDDSFEWFGGAANAKNLVAYCGLDDDFDTDYGFTGKVQYGLGVRNPRVADVSTSNGFESDNDAAGSALTPKTAPIFSNFTMIGAYDTTSTSNVSASYGAGAHIRRNSAMSLFNTVFAGWNTAGILVDGTSTYANLTGGTSAIKNCIVSGTKVSADAIKGATVASADVLALFNTNGNGNSVQAQNTTLKIKSSFYKPTATTAQSFTFVPGAGSALLNAASYTDAKLASFFETSQTTIGAFGSTDWTAGWCNFDPQNTVY